MTATASPGVMKPFVIRYSETAIATAVENNAKPSSRKMN